jgi:hypothetical protein
VVVGPSPHRRRLVSHRFVPPTHVADVVQASVYVLSGTIALTMPTAGIVTCNERPQIAHRGHVRCVERAVSSAAIPSTPSGLVMQSTNEVAYKVWQCVDESERNLRRISQVHFRPTSQVVSHPISCVDFTTPLSCTSYSTSIALSGDEPWVHLFNKPRLPITHT